MFCTMVAVLDNSIAIKCKITWPDTQWGHIGMYIQKYSIILYKDTGEAMVTSDKTDFWMPPGLYVALPEEYT